MTVTNRERDGKVAEWVRGQFYAGGFDGIGVGRLCRLATMLDGLLGQYWVFAQSMARSHTPVLVRADPLGRPGLVPNSGAGFADAPSPSERHRLVRAFLRFELMCRLFSIPYWPIMCFTAMKQDLTPRQVIRRLEWFAKKDWSSEAFLLMLEEEEAEQVLAVGAFVRAQWRAIIASVRILFEQNALEKSHRYSQAIATGAIDPDEDEAAPIELFFEMQTLMAPNGRTYCLEYLQGRPEPPFRGGSNPPPACEITWIDNLASGFGLKLLSRFLKTDPVKRRKSLRTLITAIEPNLPALETGTAYRFNFIHTRSFPVLPHTRRPGRKRKANPETAGRRRGGSEPVEFDRPKMRMIGYLFWDHLRLQTPLYMVLEQTWLPEPTMPPHEPRAKEQLTPGAAWNAAVITQEMYQQLASHVWIVKPPALELGRIGNYRGNRVFATLDGANWQSGL